MAVPTLQAEGVIAANTTGNLTITLPTYAADDIVVITTFGFVPNTLIGANTQTLALPFEKNFPDVTVITLGLIDEEHACWWARATSNASLGASVTITRPANWDTGGDTCWAGRAYVIRGCVTTGDPYDEFASTALTTIANPVLPAITVSGGNRLAVVFMTKADNTTTPTAATGYTVGTQALTATGTDGAFRSYRQTASANVGSVTPTGGVANAANNGNSAYFKFSFIPVPVTATASAALGGLSSSAIGTVITPEVTGVGFAALGGLSSSASATVTKVASADGSLGGLGASASATVTQSGSADAALGGLTSSLSATVTQSGSADAPLGGLSASAVGVVTIIASASGSLGEASSGATGIVVHLGSGEALLGDLTAAATGSVTEVDSMNAELGPMVATAVGTITPQPSPVSTGGGRPNYRQPKRKKVPPVIVQEVVVESTVKVVEAFVTPLFVGFTATAQGSITFSAEDDDLQVMLML